MRKLLSVLSSTLQGGVRGGLLFVALLATTNLWAYDFQSGDLYYNITSDTTVEVTYQYQWSSDNYAGLTTATIPETVTHDGINYSVTSIGYLAFYYCSALTSVTIPNSVTSIGSSVFEACHSLTKTNYTGDIASWCNIKFGGNYANPMYYSRNLYINDQEIKDLVIPNIVDSIRDYAFSHCSSFASVTIGNNVTSIGANAFEDCSSLTSITIPSSVTSIGYSAFEDCSSLTSITIPSSVTSIGYSAFRGCSSLTSITIPNSITKINSETFYYCSSLTSITIPNSVTEIGNYAFEGCSSLTSITIPNSVTSIGSCAFQVCSSLTTITIPNSVTSIGDYAFGYCSALEYLSIPNSVQYYEGDYNNEVYYLEGYSSICGCYNLKILIVPADFFGVDGDEEDYQHVKSDVFPYLPERLESLTINDGTIHRLAWDFINRNYKTLKTIDLATTTDIAIAEEAFKNCYKLENLALPSQLEYIPYMAIAECVKLQSITIPATVTEIEDRAFENCRSIKSIIFEGAESAQGPARYAAASGSSLWRIGSWAFYNCHQLQNLTIPEGVTEVGDAAFYGCTYLEDMVLPSTIQEIGDNGFALCAKLQKIHVEAVTPPTIQAKTFFDVNRQIPVYVPDNAVEAYKADPYWQEFNIIGKSNAPSAVDNISSPNADTNKLLRDGQLLILRDGKTYTITGQKL